MSNLLMISGDRALAERKLGAFYNTLEEFHKYWERIDIICPKTTNNQQPTTNNLFGNVFVHPSPWPLIFQPFWILKKGREIYKNQKFNLMTVHEYPPFYNGIGARLLWGRIKVPYVLEIMHIVGHPKASGIKECIYKLLIKLFIKSDSSKAKVVRVINKKETPEFLIKAGIPKEKLIYIPAFYVDLNVFRPRNLNKEYDLIFIGRLAKNKGVNLFLETVKKLNVKTIIVGDGPLKDYCKLKIGNWRLQDKIMLYGWAKDSAEVSELINKSKILVMLSGNEGGPRVILEAMACSVPVVAMPVGIVPDVVKNGENGYICNWNAENISQKIQQLLKADNYAKFGEKCRESATDYEKISQIRNYADNLLTIINER